MKADLVGRISGKGGFESRVEKNRKVMDDDSGDDGSDGVMGGMRTL